MEEFWIHKYELGVDNKKALLIFPHWNASHWPYKLLAKYFSDFHTIVYYCASSLMSANTEATIKNFALLEKTVLDDIANLKARGANSFNMYGVSLGSIMAFRATNILVGQNGNAGGIILNLSCASFPLAVWSGSATQSIKREWDSKGVSYSEVERAWACLSPINNLTNLKKTKILFFASSRDTVMCPSNVMSLASILADNFPKAKIRFNAFFGHYFGGAKNFLCLGAMRKFLEKN